MILWTIQTRSSLANLRALGATNAVFPDEIECSIVVANNWISEKLNSLTRVACVYPMWAWLRFDESKSRPDLRRKWLLPRGTPGCLLEIDIPDSEVLLSQFEMWTWVMSGKYVPLDSDEEHWFLNKSNGLSRDALMKRKIASWERIFDLESGSEEFWGAYESRAIQACFPVLKLNHVMNIKLFIAK